MITDQPGRVLAVFIFSPLIVASAVWLLKEPKCASKTVAIGMIVFGVSLFFYDGFWLAYRHPKVIRTV